MTRKKGRPNKTNNGSGKKVFLEALRKTMGLVAMASEMTDIPRATHYRWLQEDEAYRAEVESIKERNLDFAESKLLQNIKAGNQQAIMYYLNNKGKSRGYNHTEVEVKTPNIVINWTPPEQQQ